jgi:hypothetical protein
MEGRKNKNKEIKKKYKIKYNTSKIHFFKFHYKPTCEVGSA